MESRESMTLSFMSVTKVNKDGKMMSTIGILVWGAVCSITHHDQ